MASGLLRIFCVTEAGKESTFFLRTAGEIFGLSEVLQDLPRKVSAQALAASVIFRLDRQAFDGLLSRNYALARRVITVMGSRLRYLGDSLSAQTCDVRHRLCRLLLALAHEPARPGRLGTAAGPAGQPSQGQMAAMVCSTQPTVSETLHQLQDEGLIDIRGRCIAIRRPQALLAALEAPVIALSPAALRHKVSAGGNTMLADLHTHTSTSHGHHSAAGMYEGSGGGPGWTFRPERALPCRRNNACKLRLCRPFPGNFRDFVRAVLRACGSGSWSGKIGRCPAGRGAGLASRLPRAHGPLLVLLAVQLCDRFPAICGALPGGASPYLDRRPGGRLCPLPGIL